MGGRGGGLDVGGGGCELIDVFVAFVVAVPLAAVAFVDDEDENRSVGA